MLRATKILSALLVCGLLTAGMAHAEQQTGDGGGDGGTGGQPTAPPGSMCYLSGGLGSNFNLDELGSGYARASLNYGLPNPTHSPGWKLKVRTVATGADGEITLDDTADMTPQPDDWITGGFTSGGYFSSMYPDGTDISGGLSITGTFTDAEGNILEADGMTYPPDPVTNTC
jgi:hypothetical protein